MKTGLLLIHGVTGAPPEMRYLGSHLSSLGYDVEIPMLPGHGAGKEELFATKAEDWVAASVSSFSRLQTRCDKVFIVGLCVGAIISGLVAATDSRAAGVVFLSTHYGKIKPSNSKLRHLIPLVYLVPWLRRKIYRDQGPLFGLQDKRLRLLISQSLNTEGICDRGMYVTYLESFYQSDRLVKMLKKVAARITCPALFIHSLEDTWFGPENSLDLADDLGSTDKTILMITGCDHVITIDLRRKYIAEQIALFVQKNTEQESIINAAEPSRQLAR